MYCPSCGTLQTAELRYCNRCGANLSALKGLGQPKSLEKSIDKAIWSIVGVTVSVLAPGMSVTEDTTRALERTYEKRRS